MKNKRSPIILKPGSGRVYSMGRISSIFKADGAETNGKYSISEWWLEPNTAGIGAHSHENEDDIFFVIEGVMSFLIDGSWMDAPAGSFVLAPAGTLHDFQNRSDARAGLLNFSLSGNFEENMPGIVKWFEENPAGNAT